MQMKGNTVLVTGGGNPRSLKDYFHELASR
jgi:hypothetical protein